MAISQFKKGKNSLESQFRAFLKQYNCSSASFDEEQGIKRYTFDFQGGHFVAAFYADHTFEVLFHNIMETPMANIKLVRSCCNQANAQAIYIKYYYLADKENGTLHVHLSSICSTVDETFPSRLELFFRARRDFCDEFDKQVALSKESNVLDLETNFLQQQREMFLLNERALVSAVPPLPRGNATQPLTVSSLLSLIDYPSLDDVKVGILINLETASENEQTFHLIEDIAQYPLINALQYNDGDFAVDDALLILLGIAPAEADKNGEVPFSLKQKATITLAKTGADASTLYYRATLTPTPLPPARNGQNPEPAPVTFTLAHDLASPEKKLQEFDFMWKEAKLKLKEKDTNMSDEETLLANIDDPDLGLNLYWGRRYMAQERYVEAIECLRFVYDRLKPLFFHLTKEDNNVFIDICYYLGCCYNALRCFEKAFYFLDILRGSSKITHCHEFVNTLISSGDIRVFSVIDSLVDSIRENNEVDDLEEEGALPEHVISFLNFLRIRRADACLNFGEFKEAEKEYKHFINDPEWTDHAIDQLAAIKKMRAEMKPKTAKSKKQNKKSKE